jgi:hypothetical protein
MTQASDPKPPRFVRTAATPTIYAEGLSQLLVGVPSCRLLLHSFAAAAQGDEPETRQIACELVMPTSSLIEMTLLLLKHLHSAKGNVDPILQQWNARVSELLNSIGPIDVPGMPEPVEAKPASTFNSQT